jgi:uncharacterized protein YecT (DUF1311 family)
MVAGTAGRIGWVLAVLVAGLASGAAADPTLECSVRLSSQAEIADCLAEAEAGVEAALEAAFGFAMAAAEEYGEASARDRAVEALETGQAAWAAYRDAHCNYVGETFGGGSGTGIGIRACRVELGRARIAELLRESR